MMFISGLAEIVHMHGALPKLSQREMANENHFDDDTLPEQHFNAEKKSLLLGDTGPCRNLLVG